MKKTKGVFKIKPCAHGRSKFVVDGRMSGQRIRNFFRSEVEAQEYARKQNELLVTLNNGMSTINGELTWNPNGPSDDLFYRIRLVDIEGRIHWTVHKGNGDWWIGTPEGRVDGHFISEESARKRCVGLAETAGFRIKQ